LKTTTIAILQSVPINVHRNDLNNELVVFRADADIDCDGSGGNPDDDPYFQPDTTLHRDGEALNAYEEPFIVVPPVVCRKTTGIVLGSLALVENINTGEICFAVVGDLGPSRKVGELSPACAEQISVDPNPVTGGEQRNIIRYSIFVGVPAVINGLKYVLQRYR
jgi:Fungal chitosanase of glycosyl hydrolase group 75